MDSIIKGRRENGATKWTLFPEDVISLIQADMDIACSDTIIDAMRTRLEHPTFGYTDREDKYLEYFKYWYNKNHNYALETEDIFLSTGVMYSISGAIDILSNPGDGVLIFDPTYPPFKTMINLNKRKLLTSNLYFDEKWKIDWTDFENKMKQARIFLLCNPQNPTGKIFTHEELTKIVALCEKYEVAIVSDEIHADFDFTSPYLAIMNINTYSKQHTIACVSVSKTFNVAGLKVSAVFIKNKKWMKLFKEYGARTGIHSINLMALAVLYPAFFESDAWLSGVKETIIENKNMVTNFIKENNLPIQIREAEGTYFMWLDFSGISVKEVNKILKEEYKLALSDGKTFGEDFADYQRLVLVSDKKIIAASLQQLKKFCDDYAI